MSSVGRLTDLDSISSSCLLERKTSNPSTSLTLGCDGVGEVFAGGLCRGVDFCEEKGSTSNSSICG